MKVVSPESLKCTEISNSLFKAAEEILKGEGKEVKLTVDPDGINAMRKKNGNRLLNNSGKL